MFLIRVSLKPFDFEYISKYIDPNILNEILPINNFEKAKIISDIEKKLEIKINEKNKTKINIFPIVKFNTNLEIKDYKNNLYFDNIRIDISQPVFQVSGNLDILIDNFNINNINFKDTSISSFDLLTQIIPNLSLKYIFYVIISNIGSHQVGHLNQNLAII